jgi:hypothetical protein
MQILHDLVLFCMDIPMPTPSILIKSVLSWFDAQPVLQLRK